MLKFLFFWAILNIIVNGDSYPKFGDPDCPCVGVDVSNAVKTFHKIKVKDDMSKVTGTFPPEIGTFCKTWDNHGNDACAKWFPPAYCSQRWCFVDPCNCDKPHSASTYLPTWKYHKRPLHFSYETCGSSGVAWFESTGIVPHVSAKCSDIPMGIGSPTCPCVGISGKPGHMSLIYNGRGGLYKTEIGSTCGLWEMGAYPDCTNPESGKKPDWCFETWCYVNPCNCKEIVSAPRQTQKIAGSTIHGSPMYFSFATCGNKYLLGDGWPEKSCWTKKTKEECNSGTNLKGEQCGWSEGRGCIDGHLVPICEEEAPQLKDEL